MADSRKLLAEIDALLVEEPGNKALSDTPASLSKIKNIVDDLDE